MRQKLYRPVYISAWLAYCLAAVMETRSNRLLVFTVVGLLLVALVVFALWLFSAGNPDGREYLIRFRDSVTGVEKGSPVTYSGVPAGSVTDIRLAENDPSMVLVTVRLDHEIPILRGVKASVSRSFVGGGSTVSLDGAERGAPPIETLTGQAMPEIPAKKGGLFGSGGDPMALIEKISQSVDNVSSNLDARGQERTRERLAALTARSARWSEDAARISDTLTGAQGKISRTGNSLAGVGNGAEVLNRRISRQRGTALRSMNQTLVGVQRGASSFETSVRAARPAILDAERQRREITDRARSARARVRGLADQAEEIDRSGLQIFGAPKLPDYKAGKRELTPPSVPPRPSPP